MDHLRTATDTSLLIVGGDVYRQKRDCLSLIHAAALLQNRGAVVDKSKSGGYTVVYKCNSKTPCPFQAVFTKSIKSTANHFTVREVALKHGSWTGKAKPRCRDVARSSAAMSAVNNQMKIPGPSLQAQLKETIGVDIPVRTMYRIIEDIIEAKYGGFGDGYRKIQPFFEQFKLLNPTAHIAVEVIDNQFHRAFLLHPHWQRIQAGCQRILGTDGAHTKHKLHEGRMLTLVARDGNNRNAPLAVALCPTEDRDNYSWFIDNCKHGGVIFDDIPLFCNRGGGIISAAASHIDLCLMHCTRHIVRDMKHKLKGSLSFTLEDFVYSAQATVIDSNYESEIGILKQYRPAAHQYLRDIDRSRWCVFPNIGVRALYGWLTSNFVESENKSALQARILPPLHFLTLCADKVITQNFSRSQECAILETSGAVLTPYAQACYEVERGLMNFYSVQPVAITDAVCWHARHPLYKQRVNLASKHYSCLYSDQYRMSCRHIMAALVFFDPSHKVHSFYDHCYKVSTLSDLYSDSCPVRLPLDRELKCDGTIPLPRPIQTGRHQITRIPNRGESKASTANRAIICIICERTGHNKRSCPHRDY